MRNQLINNKNRLARAVSIAGLTTALGYSAVGCGHASPEMPAAQSESQEPTNPSSPTPSPLPTTLNFYFDICSDQVLQNTVNAATRQDLSCNTLQTVRHGDISTDEVAIDSAEWVNGNGDMQAQAAIELYGDSGAIYDYYATNNGRKLPIGKTACVLTHNADLGRNDYRCAVDPVTIAEVDVAGFFPMSDVGYKSMMNVLLQHAEIAKPN